GRCGGGGGHRVSAVRRAARSLVVHGGGGDWAGDHRELMAQNGRYAALYRQQGLNETTRSWGEATGKERLIPT
ncbi:MAG: hypothetical protein OXH09_19250, partial [Gammaproteobacteria bacterium]|nr:hypothetical protein [Gammaproteobacteria bacterium]